MYDELEREWNDKTRFTTSEGVLILCFEHVELLKAGGFDLTGVQKSVRESLRSTLGTDSLVAIGWKSTTRTRELFPRRTKFQMATYVSPPEHFIIGRMVAGWCHPLLL